MPLCPPELRAETLWVVGGTRKSSRRAQAAKLALSSARLPAARFVCFEAIAQKLHVYPGDRDDAAEVRRRALAHCGLSPGAARHVLLEERVGPACSDTKQGVIACSDPEQGVNMCVRVCA